MNVIGGRAEEQISEDGRREQHALRRRGRHSEQNVVEQRPRELVEHDQLAATRRHGEGVVAQHVVDLVAVQPGGVDEKAGPERSAGRVHKQGAVGEPLDGGDGRAQAQLAAR